MQRLQDNNGYPKVARALRYTGIRLRSRPDTAPLAAEVDSERALLDKANEAFAQIFEERVAATAVIRYMDSLVDGHVMAISRDVAVITLNKMDDPFYKTLFPTSPSTAIEPVASDSQNRFVKALVDRIESDARFDSLRPRAAELKASQTELEQAVVKREELRSPELRASVDFQAALERARRMYNNLYPRLTLMFNNRAFVETFFSKVRRTSAEVETEADLPEEEVAAEE